jgi:hypothetical protein
MSKTPRISHEEAVHLIRQTSGSGFKSLLDRVEEIHAGANGTIIGDYLTASGSKPADVLAMVANQGFSIERRAGT